MKSAIVIPARYGSSRFPGKPLAMIGQQSLIERVWRLACKAVSPSDVIIATDDDRIQKHVSALGARVVMTSESCRNGSERVWEAIQSCDELYDVVINLQGDTPLTPPQILVELISFLEKHRDAVIATPAVQLSYSEYTEIVKEVRERTGGTFVTTALDSRALYFSRFPIPYARQDSKIPDSFPLYKHIGVYAYRREALARYIELEPTPLEQLEQLEQLRALENGLPIHVVKVSLDGRTMASVDHPHDIQEVLEIIAREGEIL